MSSSLRINMLRLSLRPQNEKTTLLGLVLHYLHNDSILSFLPTMLGEPSLGRQKSQETDVLSENQGQERCPNTCQHKKHSNMYKISSAPENNSSFFHPFEIKEGT